jgi:hypothetical protein
MVSGEHVLSCVKRTIHQTPGSIDSQSYQRKQRSTGADLCLAHHFTEQESMRRALVTAGWRYQKSHLFDVFLQTDLGYFVDAEFSNGLRQHLITYTS